ncbi:MAG: hypothetical protein ACPGVG_15345, partial [Mycobacterium sp.]
MSRLQNLKVKIWSSAPGGSVFVFQDGSASDPDVTSGYRFDDGIRTGGQLPTTADRQDRVLLELQRLEREIDTGARLTFALHGKDQWWSQSMAGLRAQPGDKVELYADVPVVNAQVATPSWHLNGQTGQVRIFYGWVTDVTTSPSGPFVVQCADGMTKGNEIPLVQDADAGYTIPRIAFNVGDVNSPAFQLTVKKNSSTGAFSTGEAFDADHLMTVGEILSYLEDAYGADLTTLGVTASSSIWGAGDLSGLTNKPPQIVLEGVGFIEGVRAILRYAPDVRLFYDPRSLVFRLQRVFAGFSTTQVELTADAVNSGGRGLLTFADNASFSATAGAQGNRIRIIDRSRPDVWEEHTVHALVGGTQVELVAEVTASFQGTTPLGTRDYVYVVAADAMPTVAFPASSLIADGFAPALSTRDAYSSVDITSVHQETRTQRAGYAPGGFMGGTNNVVPGWDSAFEANWKEADGGRKADFGANGQGIPVYKSDNGGAGGRERLYIAFEDTSYDDDHVNNEWDDTACVIFTANNTNVRDAEFDYRV